MDAWWPPSSLPDTFNPAVICMNDNSLEMSPWLSSSLSSSNDPVTYTRGKNQYSGTKSLRKGWGDKQGNNKGLSRD